MTDILIVCSGNTCRSPMAAAVLADLLSTRGPASIHVSSAGTGAMDGAPASEGAYLVALEAGLDLSTHQARQLTPEMVRTADLILTMSRAHLRRVEELGGAGKAALLGSYATRATREEEIPDPFGGELELYRDTFRHLVRLMTSVRDRLEEEGLDDPR